MGMSMEMGSNVNHHDGMEDHNNGNNRMTEAQQWAQRQKVVRQEYEEGKLNTTGMKIGNRKKGRINEMEKDKNTPSPMGMKRSSAARARRAAREATAGNI